jgi:site-specific recombinase XerD
VSRHILVLSLKAVGIYEKPVKSGIWHISYCDGTGQRHREKVGGRREALEAYSNRKREIREGRYLPPRGGGRALIWRDLAAQGMEYKRLRLAPRSYESDMAKVKELTPTLGHLDAAAIQPAHIEQILAKLRNRGLCGSSANRYRSMLSSLFGYGVRMGLLRSNPVAQVKRYKESAWRVRWLKPEEEERLRKVIREKCPEREPEFDLALYTGMRRGEQFTLKWENVDLDRGLLEVNGKSGRRFITVNKSAKAALTALSQNCDKTQKSEYVCPETKSEAQRDWRRWFEDAVKEAGIKDYHWHDNRHTFASRLVMAGVPLLTVSQLLGHHSIAMTERYAHLSPDHRAAAVEMIGGQK